jgi:hypothetical protein
MVPKWYSKLPVCPLCNEAVELETSKSDEDGKAIHEECAVLQVAKTFPRASVPQND